METGKTLSSTEKAKRLHFGVIMLTLDQPLQRSFLESIMKYAGSKDINVSAYICTYSQHFSSTSQTYVYDQVQHYETCFDLVRSSNLDGLIILTGFMIENLDPDSFERHIKGIPEHIPIVSIAYALPNIPSVLADSTLGMYNAANHLIKVHGKKKIAFVKGPKGHRDAEERFEGYKKALYENGIELNDNYVIPGGFSRNSGRRAVAEIMHKRKLDIDAVIACNDEAAFGVALDLQSHGISIPNDVAVVGFDDDRDAALFKPPISTVRQDTAKMGATSVDLLCRMIDGESVDEITLIQSDFIARQSCGCVDRVFINLESFLEKELIESESLTAFSLDYILPIFTNHVPEIVAEKWIVSLVDCILEIPFTNTKLLNLLNGIFNECLNYTINHKIWADALLHLEVAVIKFCHYEYRQLILHTLTRGSLLLQDIYVNETNIRNLQGNDLRLLVRKITSTFISSMDIILLAKELHRAGIELSIDTALIALYGKKFSSNDLNAVRVIDTIFGYDMENEIFIKNDFAEANDSISPIGFSNYSTIEDFDYYLKQRNFVLFPLFLNEEELGILLFSYNPMIPSDVYETLRISVSTAINSTDMLDIFNKLSITDELTGLLNRRGFFQQTESMMHFMNRHQKEEIHSSGHKMLIAVFVDMDELKKINDTFGHNEGDTAIVAFSQVLKKSLRKTDIIGRMGGDEFAVISIISSQENSGIVVERIQEGLTSYNNEKLHKYAISASFGSVILESATMENLHKALNSADDILYVEKKKKKVSTQQHH